MMSSTTKAGCFLKDLGIFQTLSANPVFEYGGVEFEYSESIDGKGKLTFNGFNHFGQNPHTSTVLFDGGSAIKVFDTDGNRSTKKAFASDLEACYTVDK